MLQMNILLVFLSDNYFAFMNISERENSTARFVSPWICCEKDYNASLTFQFFTGQCSRNILSVFLNLNGTTRQLHTLTEKDGEIMPPIYFNISDPSVISFQVILFIIRPDAHVEFNFIMLCRYNLY